jgi:23S rRNA (uridine2552-2'-O)-methyltransferase
MAKPPTQKPPSGSAGPAGRTGARNLKQSVRTAKKRSHASTLWLDRQLNDPYVARAKAEGWRSRAAYKLIEIDDRFRLLKPGQRIVDLGCAPGGWAQVAAARVGTIAQPPRGLVVGIDLLAVDPIPGVSFTQMDFTDDDAPQRLRAMIGGDSARVDGVLSDMAANTIGHKRTDHIKIVGLAEMATDFAKDVLSPGGFFLTKLFQGGETGTLIADLKRDFATVKHVKPAASRADSSELYVLATGFRGMRQVEDRAAT